MRTCDGSGSTGTTASFMRRTTSRRFTTTPSGLIRDGNAYVDSLTADEIRDYRGTLTEPGRNSPYRDRSVEENLDLFQPDARRGVS